MALNGSRGRTQSDLRVHAKGGKVIVVMDTASSEVEIGIDLSPTQALVFAQLLDLNSDYLDLSLSTRLKEVVQR